MSEKYQFIPSIQVIDAMRKEGFMPFKASQSRSRIEGKGDFTKHMIRFRPEAAENLPGNTVAEVVLVNSHDGTSTYQLHAGLYRIICANGLVASNGTVDAIKTRHSGRGVIDEIIEGTYRIIKEAPALADHVAAMQAINLNEAHQAAFARAALQVRYDTEPGEPTPVQPEQILRAHRYEDRESNNLWTTFNRVQENIIKGGCMQTGTTGRRSHTREIKGVSDNVRLNKALWALADEMKSILA
jgi:hypothetical protein